MSIASDVDCDGNPATPPRPYVLGKSDPPARLIMGPAVSIVIVEAEHLDAEDRQIAQHRRLHHPEHEPGREEHDERGAPSPPPDAGRRRPHGHIPGERGAMPQVGERPPGEAHGQGQHHRAGTDPRAPAERGGDGRQGQRRGHAAQRESHLLDPHRDAALAHREHVHDGAAEGGIDHAPADAGHDQAAEKEGEAGRERGGEQARRADGEPTEEARAHADPVGEPAAGKREEQPADVDRRDDEGELEAGEAKAVEQARRQHGESPSIPKAPAP